MLIKLNDLLREQGISIEPQAWAKAHNIELAHIEKRGTTAVCFLLAEQREAVIAACVQDVVKAVETKREQGKRVEPLGIGHRFMPTAQAMERLVAIERKLDAICAELGIKV